MRAVDGGYATRFQAFFVALSFLRFDGESTLPPTVAIPLATLGDNDARRWATDIAKKEFLRRNSIFLDGPFGLHSIHWQGAPS
jgi:hypothetical protein